MKQLTVVQTFISRFLILILSFGLVIYSTNMWGSAGKGTISIVIANTAVIGFLSNVFAGSSISYFASKYKTENVLMYAYLWSIIVGITVPLIFSFYIQQEYLIYLIGLSVLSSLLSANINLFIGRKNIQMFNLYTILQQAVHILFIAAFVYLFRITEVTTFFIAQICSYGFLFLISSFQLLYRCDLSNISFSKDVLKSMFVYGWKSQLSAFIQFLNYRLSFYFLEYFQGIAVVGIFSIGVTFSEAIWTISRSLAVILYSDVVNSNDSQESIEKTKTSIKITFLITILSLLGILMVPAQLYTLIFGKDFNQTKEIILLLSPGIVAIAVSNIVGFYFAGINELGVLNVKSIAGLVFTVAFSFYAVPNWGIYGACLVTTLSYCLSSAILFRKFYQSTEFRVKDYFISKTEISFFLQKLLKK
ncbi:O-antigen/teichoic acid export membrane protein [Chryseobacterium sp. H1D6B]|uniref:polysaccharide biosynthesis C-terminal domain-containing protein n=1 Tax=Chryseobacterium sp. H1D6B TaxID=2940588 RepID=UPI0015CBA57B|nr:polysaccharide biosynthesis C-terminal domain-containing protein [Chryseobacterium sp. H1D6B]MDH6251390.1 O-antigen/teichoic acid export membrane protein [Chryseobacterium sp. H1D6B]